MNPDLFQLETIPEPPNIDPVPDSVERPLFSVMIPVCNRTKYLCQTIESVLHENYPPSDMQICIVDNSTEKIDWDSFFTSEETRRIEIFRQPEHVGMAENWNTCIRQARGHLVHILHDDDWVLPGFYNEVENLRMYQACLYYVRCFAVEGDGFISWVYPRRKEFEKGNFDYNAFVSGNPFPCPGVVMKRKYYEDHGGFRATLHSADMEMWVRATIQFGAVASPKVLACYRHYDENMTHNLFETAENLKDLLRLFIFLKNTIKGYPFEKSLETLHAMASAQEAAMRAKNKKAASKEAQMLIMSLRKQIINPKSPVKWFLHGISNSIKRIAERI